LIRKQNFPKIRVIKTKIHHFDLISQPNFAIFLKSKKLGNLNHFQLFQNLNQLLSKRNLLKICAKSLKILPIPLNASFHLFSCQITHQHITLPSEFPLLNFGFLVAPPAHQDRRVREADQETQSVRLLERKHGFQVLYKQIGKIEVRGP
jgi:hypothetical protein